MHISQGRARAQLETRINQLQDTLVRRLEKLWTCMDEAELRNIVATQGLSPSMASIWNGYVDVLRAKQICRQIGKKKRPPKKTKNGQFQTTCKEIQKKGPDAQRITSGPLLRRGFANAFILDACFVCNSETCVCSSTGSSSQASSSSSSRN